ncbi:MAG: hypothetical protein WCG07_00940 [Candidatus Taylorbacteria bacterium]
MKKPKNRVAYIYPTNKATNDSIVGILGDRAEDSFSPHRKMVCAKTPIPTFEITGNDLKALIENAGVENHLSYKLFRMTIDGLVPLIDVQYWIGVTSPSIVRRSALRTPKIKKAEADLARAIARRRQETPLVTV